MIIGVTGYAQNGKDTLGARLIDKHDFQRFALADGVRRAALAINPFVFSDAPMRLSSVVAIRGWEEAKQIAEVRRLLQRVGTEAGRDIHGPDVWINALQQQIEGEYGPIEEMKERVVVTDVRFPNEAAWIKRMGGLMVRVVRVNEDGTPFDNGVAASHPSEAYIADLPVDRVVLNYGDSSFMDEVDKVVSPDQPGAPSIADAMRAADKVTGLTSQIVRTREALVASRCDDACCEQSAEIVTTDYELIEDVPPARYGYRRTDKLADHERLDAMRGECYCPATNVCKPSCADVRGGGNGYGEGA